MFLDVSPRRLSSTLLLMLAPAVLRAQERRDTVRLDPIVVTATRLATPATAIASAVTVLRGEDLRAQGITTVADALRAVPGAAIVRTGAVGGQTSLFLRGGESDYVKVLVDGVPVNQPGGAFDWADLTTDNVERIEVVRGPGSVLYGSDAVAGVVQIFTRRGAGPAVALASVVAGTYGTVRAEAGLTGGSEDVGYSFTASRLATDGNYAFNNAYRNTVLSGLVRLRPDDRSDATVSLRATSSTFHYPTNGAGRLVDHNQFRYGDVTTLGLELGRYLTRRVEARFQIASNAPVGGLDNQRDSAADSSVYRSLDDQRRTLVGARANVYLAGGTVLTAGVELERQRVKSFNVCNSAFGPCSTEPSDHHRGNRGYFVQALADIGPALALTAGARLDDNDAFGTHATYRLGVAWRLPGGGATRLRAALGTGFKEPTFFENFAHDPFVKGNPGLKPERSVSWELGAERSLAGGRVALAATYFRQRFRDLVDFTFAPPSSGDPNYFNVEGALADGVEATATVAPWPRVSVTAGYTYLHTRVTRTGFDSTPDAAFAPGAALLRRPTHSADLRVRWSAAGGRLGTWLAGARYVGARVDQDFSTFPFPRVRLAEYVQVDVAYETAEIRTGAMGPGLHGTLRIENLLDRRYEEVRGFPARHRTVLVGVQAGFGR